MTPELDQIHVSDLLDRGSRSCLLTTHHPLVVTKEQNRQSSNTIDSSPRISFPARPYLKIYLRDEQAPLLKAMDDIELMNLVHCRRESLSMGGRVCVAERLWFDHKYERNSTCQTQEEHVELRESATLEALIENCAATFMITLVVSTPR